MRAFAFLPSFLFTLLIFSATLTLTLTLTPAHAQVTGSMDYTINGVASKKPIVEQVFGTAGTVKLPTATTPANYTGMWWAGVRENGWGVNITHQPGTAAQGGGVIFATVFIYDSAGKPTWVVGILYPDVANNFIKWSGRTYATTSSAWLGVPYDASKFVANDVGSMNLDFTQGQAGAWKFNVKTLWNSGIINNTLVSSSLAARNFLLTNPPATFVGDDNWIANLKSGNIQIVESGEMAPDINGVQRNIWRAVYSMTNGITTGYCIHPIFADTGMSYISDNRVGITCFTSAPIYVVGVSDSVTPANNSVIYAFMNGGNQLCSRLTVLGGGLTPCPF